VRWCKKSFLMLLACACETTKSKLERLLELLEDSDDGTITVRSLTTNHVLTKRNLALLLEFYPSMIRQEVKKPKTGRPSTIIRLVNSPE
jgi:hypothetical protein